MSGADYTRINKNMGFDDIRGELAKGEHKDAKQLRVKHDMKNDGKVQFASKMGSEGKHKLLSNRGAKFRNANTFVLDALRRTTGVKASKSIKNMVKADQTAAGDSGKTIGRMLDDVRDQWHSEATEKYSSGKGFDRVVKDAGRNLPRHQQAALKSFAKCGFIQTEVEAKIKSVIADKGGATLSDKEIKKIAAGEVEKYITSQIGKLTPAAADLVVSKLAEIADPKKSTTEAAQAAKELVAGLEKLDRTPDKVTGPLKTNLSAAIFASLDSRGEDIRDVCRDLGQTLFRMELKSSANQGSLLRANNRSSKFTRAYLEKYCSDFANGLQDKFEKAFDNIEMPGPVSYFNSDNELAVEYDVDKVIKDPEKYGFEPNSAEINELKQKRDAAVLEASEALTKVVAESYSEMPQELIDYAADLATDAKDPKFVGHLKGDGSVVNSVLNDVVFLRLVNANLGTKYGSQRQRAVNGVFPKEQIMQHKLRFDSTIAVNRVFTATTNSEDPRGSGAAKLQDRVTSKCLGQAKTLIGRMADRYGQTFDKHPDIGNPVKKIRSDLEQFNVKQGYRDLVDQGIAEIGSSLSKGDVQTAAQQLSRLQGQVSTLVSNAILTDPEERNDQVEMWLQFNVFDETGVRDSDSTEFKACFNAITKAMDEYDNLVEEEQWQAAYEQVKQRPQIKSLFDNLIKKHEQPVVDESQEQNYVTPDGIALPQQSITPGN